MNQHAINMQPDPDYIKAESVGINIGGNKILKDVSFTIAHGSVTSVIGPSGSGKSTLLRTLAGFHDISAGKLSIGGQLVAGANFCIPPEKRSIGVVFQDAPLFQHLTVEENIKVAMKQSFAPKNQTGHYLNILIDMMQLQHLQYRYAHELSGGQQQRVALARALALDSKIMLLDEPFANLNEDLHMQIAESIFNWFYDRGTTVMLVTHDQYDAMAISDNVLVLMDGRCVQQDTSEKLFDAPKSKDIAKFVHRGALVASTVCETKTLTQKQHQIVLQKVDAELHQHQTASYAFDCEDDALPQNSFSADSPFGRVRIKAESAKKIKSGDKVYLWVQPEDFTIVCVNEGQSGCFGMAGQIQGTIARIIWRTTDILLHVDFPQVEQEGEQSHILVKVSQSGAYHQSQPFEIDKKVILALKDHEYNVYAEI